MDWDKFIAQMLVTFVVAFLGWIVAHKSVTRRDLANERRKLRVSYQVEVFEKLQKAAPGTDPKALEEAIAKIQILGSKEQVTLAMKIGHSLTLGNKADIDSYNELIGNVRDKLREELELEPINEQIRYLDLKKPQK